MKRLPCGLHVRLEALELCLHCLLAVRIGPRGLVAYLLDEQIGAGVGGALRQIGVARLHRQLEQLAVRRHRGVDGRRGLQLQRPCELLSERVPTDQEPVGVEQPIGVRGVVESTAPVAPAVGVTRTVAWAR